jgi:hydroxyacylglutathione hydrolase
MKVGKLFLVVLTIVVAICGGGILALRAGRDKVSDVSEVKPGIVVVTNSGGIGVFAARVGAGPHVILFDAGFDPKGRPVDAVLAGLHAGRDDVTDVFVTHAHPDHIGGLNVLPNKALIHIGAADVPVLIGQARPPALVPMVLSVFMPAPPVAMNAPPLTGVVTIAESDGAGHAKPVKAIPVPGHTPGSYAFLYDGVLFVGDIMILKEGRLEPTPRIVNPDPEANKASIRSLKSQLAGETLDIVCTSHGGCTPKGLGRDLLDDLIVRVGG